MRELVSKGEDGPGLKGREFDWFLGANFAVCWRDLTGVGRGLEGI